MSFSITYAGNGNFNMTIDGKSQTFNLADLDLMVRIEQVEQYDVQIADQLKEIQQTNMKRKQLNELLSKMRQAKTEGRDDDGVDSTYGNKGSLTFTLEGTDGQTRNLHAWMDYFGLSKVDVDYASDAKVRDGKWDTNINAVKTAIDNITSDSEMQMLRFRQLVDKRGTALSEARSTLRADTQLKDKIVQ